MTAAHYLPPVDKLLAYGDCRKFREWPDYLALGLNSEHIPDLIRMAVDEALHQADSESEEVWAPIHAWRALGQLRAEVAIEPLLGLLHRVDDDNDDWTSDDLPKVFGLIGSPAVPVLAAYLDDAAHGLYARTAAAHSLMEIAQRHPVARDECVAALTRTLDRADEPDRDPALNGFLVAFLLDLAAIESAPVMERAFAAGLVDESVAGDWEDVQIEFGLKAERTHPPKPTWLDKFRPPDLGEEDVEPPRPVPEYIRQWNEKVAAERQEKAQMKGEQAQRREEKKRHRRRRM